MKINFRAAALAALSLTSLSAVASVYSDATGDINVGSFPHIDISSVEVTNTLTDLTLTINLAGDPIATNWGKYNIIMRSPSVGSVDTSANGNPWTRPYSLDGGANRFIGGWADQPTNNSQLWSYSGSWSKDADFTSTITSSSLSYTVSLASLGLSAGDVLRFDVVTTGGGNTDTAVDTLSRSSGEVSAWDQTTVVSGLDYQVTGVPEPTSMAALGLGVAAMLRRRRR
jgi:hypothetical protein